MIHRAYNYGHYKAERSHDIKIKKCDLYKMLDNDETLLNSLVAKKVKDDLRYHDNCKGLERHGFKTAGVNK